MNALRMLIPVVSLAAASFACSETKQQQRPVETTSAQMKEEATRNEMAQLQRERNEARSALAEERNARDLERQRTMSEDAQRREHDELELRVIGSLDKANSQLGTLHEKNAKATAKQKKENEKTITDVNMYQQKLYGDLTRLHGDLGKPWDAFKADVDTDLQSLDQALSSAGTMDTTKQPTQQKAKTGTQKQQKEPQQQTPSTKQPQQTPAPTPTMPPGAKQQQQPMQQQRPMQPQQNEPQTTPVYP